MAGGRDAGMADKLKGEFPSRHVEICVNEKTAYEAAVAGAYAGKRTGCIFSVEGVYEALDPLMSSAYSGVKGGFVIVCIKNNGLDVTPLGPFSKLPVLVCDGTAGDLAAALPFAYSLSERHEIPCLVQSPPVDGTLTGVKERADGPAGLTQADFVRNPGRWAATPKFRYELHRVLNDKIERIREEFETYQGNEEVFRGKRGVITHRSCTEAGTGQESLLRLGSVFPLPLRTVSDFMERMDDVEIREGACPAIGLQVGTRRQISRLRYLERPPQGSPRDPGAPPLHEEHLFGLRVVRDGLGPASSINLAHGMVRSRGASGVLAVTDEASFLHSGLPAFVNALYNGSSYLLVIKNVTGADRLRALLDGFGFKRHFSIARPEDVERYAGEGGLTVLLCEGDL